MAALLMYGLLYNGGAGVFKIAKEGRTLLLGRLGRV
jgi:hypothetical protein